LRSMRVQSLPLKLARHWTPKTAPSRPGYASVQQRWTVRTLCYLLKLLLIMGVLCFCLCLEGQVPCTVQLHSASTFEFAADQLSSLSARKLRITRPTGNLLKSTISLADEVEEIQTGTHEPAKPTSTNGFPSSAVPPPVSQAASTSTAPSVLHGSPSGDEPSMPPPVDPNQPKYRLHFEHAAHVTSILSQTGSHFALYAFDIQQGSAQTMTGNMVLYINCMSMTVTWCKG